VRVGEHKIPYYRALRFTATNCCEQTVVTQWGLTAQLMHFRLYLTVTSLLMYIVSHASLNDMDTLTEMCR